MPPTNSTSSISSDDVTEAAPSPSPATRIGNDKNTGERACDESNSNSNIHSSSKDCSHTGTSEKDVHDIKVDINEDDIDTKKKKYPNPNPQLQLQQINASTNASHVTLSNNAIAIAITKTTNSNKTSRAASCGKPKRRTVQKMAVSTKIAGTVKKQKQKEIQKQPQTPTTQKTTRRKRTVVLLHSPSHTALMHSTMKHIHQDRDILLSSLLYCCGFIKDAPRFFRVIKPRVATRSHLECFHQRDYLDLIENNNQHYDCGFHGRGRGLGRGYCLSRARMRDNNRATESRRVRSAVCGDLEMELGLEEHEHEQHYYDIVDDDDDGDGGDRDSVGKSLAQTPANVKANANDAYHKLLDAYGLTDDCFLPSDPIQRDQLWKYCLAIAGASIHAAQLLVSRHPREGAGVGVGVGVGTDSSYVDSDTNAGADADVAINWSGGRHHAHADKASGFCYVNDVVLAIHTLIKNMDLNQRQQRQRKRQRERQHSGEKQRQQDERRTNNHRNLILRQRRQRRVMYLDVDIHHADGVQSAFYSTDQVLTISLHRHAPGFFPSQSGSNREKGKHGTPGVGYNLNIPLPRSLCDDDYVMMVQEVLDEVGVVYDPDVVVLCVGADGLRGDDLVKDTMEGWNLTPEGLAESVRRVACFCAGVPHGVAHAHADESGDAYADESGDDYDYDSQSDGRDDTQSNRRKFRNRKLLILGGGGYNPVNTARALLLCTAAACEGARPGMLWRELPTDVPRHEHFDRYGPSFELVQRQRRTHASDNANVTFDARTGGLDSNLSIYNDKRSTITGKGMLERTDGYSRTIEQAKRDINLTHLFLSNQQFVQEGEVIGDFDCCGDFKDSDCTLYDNKGSSTSCNITIAGTISAIDRKPTVIENHAAAVNPKTRKLSRRRRRQK